MDDAKKKRGGSSAGDCIQARLERGIADAKKKGAGRPKDPAKKRVRKPAVPEADFLMVPRDEVASWGDALSEAAVLLSAAASSARSAKHWERAALALSRKVTRIRGMLAKKPAD